MVSSMVERASRPPRGVRGGPGIARCPRSDLHDVGGLLALVAVDDIKLDAVALRQGAEARSLDCRKVNEHFLALVGCDEAESLSLVEPFHRALDARPATGHDRNRSRPPRRSTAARRTIGTPGALRLA